MRYKINKAGGACFCESNCFFNTFSFGDSSQSAGNADVYGDGYEVGPGSTITNAAGDSITGINYELVKWIQILVPDEGEVEEVYT